MKVTGNTDKSSDFDLDKPLAAGFFAWNLFLDRSPTSYDQHELVTVGFGPGAFEMPMALTAGQDIWNQSSATVWLDRQADLRICLAIKDAQRGANAAGGDCKVKPGIWVKGQGAWIKRDGSTERFTSQGRLYSFDRGYRLSLGGLVSGIDAGWDNVISGNDAALVGLMGGYIDTSVAFHGGTRWDIAGPILGAYATYLTEGFYLDALLKADLLGVDVDSGNLGGGGKDRADECRHAVRYRLPDWARRRLFIEPEAMLAGVRTNIRISLLRWHSCL